MPFDWFTVGAQVLNFLILVWLMKRFLYKPVLRALDAREAGIAGELAEAAATKTAAESERDAFRQRNERFDQERAALLAAAKDEANAECKRLIEAERTALELQRRKHQEARMIEAESFNRSLRKEAQTEVFSLARRTLGDLADTALEQRATGVFLERLRNLDADAKGRLAQALKAAAVPALLSSAFELPQDQRAAIQNALNETASAEVPLHFRTAPELVCGIEVSTAGEKVTWSISQYLDDMETSLGKLVTQTAGSPPQS